MPLLDFLRKPVGRVVTNLIKPESYDLASHLERLKKAGPKKIIKAVVKDEPIYDLSKSELIPGRSFLWRKAFGLPEYNKTRKQSKQIFDVFTDKKGRITHVSLKPGSMPMVEVNNNVINKTRNVKLPSDLKDDFNSFMDDIVNISDTYNSVMGSYTLKIPKRGKATYFDKWDIGLNKGETAKTLKENYGVSKKQDKVLKYRRIMDKITKPIDIKGEVVATNPKSVKLSNPAEARKVINKVKREYEKNDFELTDDIANDLYHLVVGSNIRKGIISTKAPTPRQVKKLDIAKHKLTKIPNVKKIIKDLKETKYEVRRADNTLADDKLMGAVKKIHSRAKKNALIAGTQIAALPTATYGTYTYFNKR